MAQGRIVLSFFFFIEQASTGLGQQFEKLSTEPRMTAGEKLPHMLNLPVGGTSDHIGIVLEQIDAEQAIVIGRPLRVANRQPLDVGIEGGIEGLGLKFCQQDVGCLF